MQQQASLIFLLLATVATILQSQEIDPQCKPVSQLNFCSQINYQIASTFIPNAQRTDSDTEGVYQRTKGTLNIQTTECMQAFKSYLCASRLPTCPYCSLQNGMCRSGCLEYMAACASSPGDTALTCFTGDLFVVRAKIG